MVSVAGGTGDIGASVGKGDVAVWSGLVFGHWRTAIEAAALGKQKNTPFLWWRIAFHETTGRIKKRG